MKKFVLMIMLTISSPLLFAQAEEDAVPGTDYGNNIISVSPILFNNAGRGAGVNYERMVEPSGKLSLWVPLIFNIRDHDVDGKYYHDRSVGIFAGLKFYPASSRGPVKYSIGLSVGNYTIKRHYSRIVSPGGSAEINEDLTINKTGAMIDNAVQFNFARHVSLGLNLGLGIAGSSEVEYDGTEPFALLMFHVGYRF